jgi:hypothetical protein
MLNDGVVAFNTSGGGADAQSESISVQQAHLQQ